MKKVLSAVLSVILIAIILLAGLFAFTTLATRDSSHVSSVLGFTPLSVKSDSMAPFFKAGDMILIKKCDVSSLKVGDVITFRAFIMNELALNTHRIISIEEGSGFRSFTTQGDNNAIPDLSIVTDNDIIGKYVGKLTGFGKVMDFLSSPTGFLVIIVLPMLAFFVYQVYHLITVFLKYKKAAAIETAEEISAATDETLKAKEDALRAALEENERLKAQMEAAKKQEENSTKE